MTKASKTTRNTKSPMKDRAVMIKDKAIKTVRLYGPNKKATQLIKIMTNATDTPCATV